VALAVAAACSHDADGLFGRGHKGRRYVQHIRDFTICGKIGQTASSRSQRRQAERCGQPQKPAPSRASRARAPGHRVSQAGATGPGSTGAATGRFLSLLRRLRVRSCTGTMSVTAPMLQRAGLYKPQSTEREQEMSGGVALSVVVKLKDEAGTVVPLARASCGPLAGQDHENLFVDERVERRHRCRVRREKRDSQMRVLRPGRKPGPEPPHSARGTGGAQATSSSLDGDGRMIPPTSPSAGGDGRRADVAHGLGGRVSARV